MKKFGLNSSPLTFVKMFAFYIVRVVPVNDYQMRIKEERERETHDQRKEREREVVLEDEFKQKISLSN